MTENEEKPKWKVVDKKGCGKVAFYLKKPVYNGMLMPSVEDTMLPDGSNPLAGDLIKCGSCNKVMQYWECQKND